MQTECADLDPVGSGVRRGMALEIRLAMRRIADSDPRWAEAIIKWARTRRTAVARQAQVETADFRRGYAAALDDVEGFLVARVQREAGR